MKKQLGIAVGLVFLLAACGGGDDAGSDDDSAQLGQDAPACADVWVAGETLPDGYEGCAQEDGSYFTSGTQECADGSRFASYEDGGQSWYSDADDVIVEIDGEMSADAGYSERFYSCSGS